MRAGKLQDSNPVVYFDVSIDGSAVGRMVFELYRHTLPRVSQWNLGRRL